jgi:hypothetical protein
MDGAELLPGSIGYPRPQLRRENWQPLSGLWDFAFDDDAAVRDPDAVEWQHRIRVPYAPETAASGIGLFSGVLVSPVV